MSPLFAHSEANGLIQVESWRAKTWLIHGFTTRQAGDFATLDAVPSAMKTWGASELTFESVRQTHSDRVHISESGSAREADHPEADAILTQSQGSLVSVRTADCLPLLFVDESRRALAAVHAGWRGTAQQITQRAVERMRDEFGSRSQDLEVAIGPAIGVCCYEVGPEVADQFPASSIQHKQRAHLDLVAENRRQLIESGVVPEQIHAAGLCTHCRSDLFHSHRRDGAAAGRMMAVIGALPT
jgi:hypothetical protein